MTVLLRRNQQTMFRIAKYEHGWSQEAIHAATHMSKTSIGEYARGETSMSGEAILKLAAVKDFPSALLSLLFEDTNRHVTDDAPEDRELDDLADEADEVARDIRRARRPDSPGGSNIVEIERNQVRAKLHRLGARASKVAGE